MNMSNDELLVFFQSLLPLHERRIKEKLIEKGVDLDQFLDYTQARLNLAIQNDLDIKNRTKDSNSALAFLDGTKFISDIKKIQGVIVKQVDDSQGSDKVELKSLCLFLFFKTDFTAPAKNDKAKWAQILSDYGFEQIFTAASIGKTFNDLNSVANRSSLERKHYNQAEELFSKYPDNPGLKKLLQLRIDNLK